MKRPPTPTGKARRGFSKLLRSHHAFLLLIQPFGLVQLFTAPVPHIGSKARGTHPASPHPDFIFRFTVSGFLSFFHLYLTTSSALMSTRPSPVGWAFNAFSKNFFRARGVAPLKKLLCCVSFAALTPLHLKKLSPALCSCGFCSLHKVSKDK